MNKVSLLTIGKKLQDNNLYVLSIHDLEPSGLIVHAYDQINSKEYVLPVTEHEVKTIMITINRSNNICTCTLLMTPKSLSDFAAMLFSWPNLVFTAPQIVYPPCWSL